MITRRAVLRYGLSGAALLAAGGVTLSLQPTVMRRPARPLRVLSEREFSILAAVAERIAPGGRGFPPASRIGVAEGVDAYLASKPPAVRQEFRQVLALFENALGGLLLDGRPRTFTGSTAEQQDAILERWRGSRLHVRRTIYTALHSLCSATYYASPQVYAACGYPGPPSYGNVVPARSAP